MKRVVVTGMGAVTPIGNTVADFWGNLIAGKNGIDKITYFDTSDLKFTLAGEVKDLDVAERLDKITARKTDLFVQYALCAADEAIKDSGLEGKVDSERFGVYFGSGIGGFNTLAKEHEALLTSGPRKPMPESQR